ncbi:MAG: hypothetical protein KAJ14_00090, partial [Candidatus Omnitrophica bacterium]|nr:hypothetical protein [Candidatus Omnitrophota bacterium]
MYLIPGSYQVKSRFWVFNPLYEYSENKSAFSEWSEEEIEIRKNSLEDNGDFGDARYSETETRSPMLREDLVKLNESEKTYGIMEIGVVPESVPAAWGMKIQVSYVDWRIENDTQLLYRQGVNPKLFIDYEPWDPIYADQTFYQEGFYSRVPILLDELVLNETIFFDKERIWELNRSSDAYEGKVWIKVEAVYMDNEENPRLSPSTIYSKDISIPKKIVAEVRDVPWKDVPPCKYIVEVQGNNVNTLHYFETDLVETCYQAVEEYDTSDEDIKILSQGWYFKDKKSAEYITDITVENMLNLYEMPENIAQKVETIYSLQTRVREYKIEKESEVEHSFYLFEEDSDQPAVFIGNRIISVFDKENNIFYYYHPGTGSLVYTESLYSIIGNNETQEINVSEHIKQLAKSQGVIFEKRNDPFVHIFSQLVEDLNAAEVWVKTIDGKNTYLIYANGYSYPVIIIDDISIYLVESLNGEFKRELMFIKNPVYVPGMNFPQMGIKEKIGEVVTADELKGVSAIEIDSLPLKLEKYVVPLNDNVRFVYYQEPGDVYGRTILSFMYTDDEVYAYYVKEYDENNSVQPKEAYLYFISNTDHEWLECNKYEVGKEVDGNNLISNFGLTGNKLDTLKDTLIFIAFGEDISYQNLS